MNTARSVTVIPQTLHPLTGIPMGTTVKRRVAAYARVSTDSEEQLSSYEAQVDYYTKYIKSKPEWEFVNVYTDEGITGTNTNRRDGFNALVRDGLNGKFDLLITKSISRFARNTVDSLVTVRSFKAKGVEVYFEKENIYTLDGKGELLITIMSSLAQEESRSLSENVKWGKRKSFSDGNVSLPYKRFLGFEKGEDGLPSIVKEEAAIVRKIYSLFMSGKTPGGIASILTKEGIPTPSGKSKWCPSTVLSILTNEKYKGSALLQKAFTVDFLTKTRKKNEGEVPQYYIENSHEAIIDPIEFEWVQVEIARRKELGKQYSGISVLSTKIVCGDCGDFFGPKVWFSNTDHRKIIWRCNNKYENEKPCTSGHLTEDDIKKRFIKAYNILMKENPNIIEDCRLMQQAVSDCADLDKKLVVLYEEAEVVAELIKKAVHENARECLDQDEYLKRYNGYVQRYERIKNDIALLEEEKNKRATKGLLIGGFMFEVKEIGNSIDKFDDELWMLVIDKVVSYGNGRLVFKFRNGIEIEG